MTTFTVRRAARVLLVDGSGRLLLLHGHDPGRPGHSYWFTPGGGLEPDELPAVGAARELAEETGLRLDPTALVGPVWREVVEFSFDGRWYRQEQEFFTARVPVWEVDTTGFDDIERATIDRHRWWTSAEIAATDERIYPDDLAGLVSRVLEEGRC
ncbi:NUDIX hydrolase [Plantactinospora sp. GCM10030261]|uniref:NUDIX hydrolase n=1 Tax=Plantactinospora sp. GCM10030261 TaxID=3273420 RepID=UPI00361DC6C6